MQSRWKYVRPGASALAALILFSGCSELRPPNEQELARGYILLLPGVESSGFYIVGMIAGLRDGGIDQAIDMEMWGVRPFGSLPNLIDYKANRKEAQRLAGKIARYRRQHPAAPTNIIGYSGGGGIALFTAEALPEDVAIDRIVLIGAAISPRYSLAGALSRCRHGIVNFYSEQDWLPVGLGTQMLGTMDRQKTASAGYRGFRNADGEVLVCAGLTQIPWSAEGGALGHGGDHHGWLAREWSCAVLAPQLREPPGGVSARTGQRGQS